MQRFSDKLQNVLTLNTESIETGICVLDIEEDQPEESLSMSLCHLNINTTSSSFSFGLKIHLFIVGHLSNDLSQTITLAWYNPFFVFMLWNDSDFNELGEPHQ